MKIKTSILIINDDQIMHEVLKEILIGEGYDLFFATNGKEGVEKAMVCKPDVILLDLMKPEMDSFEVCQQLRALREMPVPIIISLDDRDSRIKGLNYGADDYLTKPIERAELQARIRTISRLDRYRHERSRCETLIDSSPDAIIIIDEHGIIQMMNPSARMALNDSTDDLIGNPFISLLPVEDVPLFLEEHQTLLQNGSTTLRMETEVHQKEHYYIPVELHAKRFEWNEKPYIQIITKDISDRILAEQQLKKAFDTLQESLEETITGWGRTLELRDKDTLGHTQRAIEVTVEVARKMGFNDEQLVHIRRGVALHDIGKIGIPDNILFKTDILSEEEWAIMRKHPIYAYEMLSSIFFLLPASVIPLSHHERWDGAGYPQGLKGEEIPLEARIFALVDVWDALCSNRPYRKAWNIEKIINYIRQNSSLLFDPNLVEPFLEIISKREI